MNTESQNSIIDTKSTLPYTPAVPALGFVFVSGQVGLNPETRALVGEDFASQFRQAVINLEAVLKTQELALRDLVKVTVYLTQADDYDEFNVLYRELFPQPYAARTTIIVHALPMRACVELEGIARQTPEVSE